MTIEGKIKLIADTKAFGSNNFQKRDVVVTTDEQYPQHILIEFVQDKCSLLDNFSIGQNVKIDLNLRGREWTNPQGEVKYFNAIQGWRIEAVAQIEPQDKPQDELTTEEKEDLPF